MDGPRIPEKPSVDGIESRWADVWEEQGTYRFDRSKSRDEVFSIDAPPPTVSGALHPGHVCSYTHTDFIARYQERFTVAPQLGLPRSRGGLAGYFGYDPIRYIEPRLAGTPSAAATVS